MKTNNMNFYNIEKTRKLRKQGVYRKTEKTGKQKYILPFRGVYIATKSENRGDIIKHESLEVAPLLSFLSFLRFLSFLKISCFLRFLSFFKIEKQKIVSVLQGANL